jgi:signal transduction histidine kinase
MMDRRRRIVRRIWAAAAAANTISVASAMVVLLMGGRIHVGPWPLDTTVSIILTLAAPGYVLSLLLMWISARWVARRYLGWDIDGRSATPHDLARLEGLPRAVAALNLVYWTFFAVAAIGGVTHLYGFQLTGWAIPKTTLVFLLGDIVGTALAFVLIERVLRPYVAAILPTDVRQWPTSIGVTGRLLGLWFVVAGAPFIFIGLTWIGLSDRQMVLGGPALRVWTLLAAFVGLVVFLIAGRTITVPLRRLEDAFQLVAQGDLTRSVDIGDPGELGHLEAGFNNMVSGLRRLETSNAELNEKLREQLSEVQASRVRIVEAADAERARIERNLHDGAQQRLLSLAFVLRGVERTLEADGSPLARARVQASLEELDAAMTELRELARGIHPAILDDEGLGPALTSLAERAAIPVELIVELAVRLPTAVEVTAYFVVAEALTNTARYADASKATISAALTDGELHLRVCDDGKGGADPGQGSGLRGLADRIAALGGRFAVESDPGRGTTVCVEIPCG